MKQELVTMLEQLLAKLTPAQTRELEKSESLCLMIGGAEIDRMTLSGMEETVEHLRGYGSGHCITSLRAGKMIIA